MAIEDNLIVLRVRFFRHDLEDALKLFYRRDPVRLSNTAESDSLFSVYFERTFSLVSEGDSLRAEIVASGEDFDIWWYELQFRAEHPVEQLDIMNRTLFNLFDDQQNIFHLTHFPDEERKTLYFVRGSEHYTVVFNLQ